MIDEDVWNNMSRFIILVFKRFNECKSNRNWKFVLHYLLTISQLLLSRGVFSSFKHINKSRKVTVPFYLIKV